MSRSLVCLDSNVLIDVSDGRDDELLGLYLPRCSGEFPLETNPISLPRCRYWLERGGPQFPVETLGAEAGFHDVDITPKSLWAAPALRFSGFHVETFWNIERVSTGNQRLISLPACATGARGGQGQDRQFPLETFSRWGGMGCQIL